VTMYLVIGAATAAILAMVIWLHGQQRAAIERMDDRLAHLMAGLTLLTDTTETGLRDVAMELGRVSAAKAEPAPKSRAVTQRRVTSAVKSGRKVRDIAATEGVSEGEVRLHLKMDKARKERANHASVR